MLIPWRLVGPCVLVAASCLAQESPPLETGRLAAERATYAVGMSCPPHSHTSLCVSPASIYAWNVTLALKGNVEAAYQVGLAYFEGTGVRPDLARAEHWFQIGAQSQYDKRWVGDQYRRGRFIPRNLERTDFWYRSAGDHDSLLQLARIYRAGELAAPDPAKSSELCLELLKGNDGYVRLAEFELGNMVLDDQYTSGDPRRDLRWAREIAQELIGGEEARLAWAHGSAMDLPGTPEVRQAVTRSAAAFDADLPQMQMADVFPSIGATERYAWEYLSGRHQADAAGKAQALVASMSAADRNLAEEAVNHLEHNREIAGAYYRDDDPLLAPDFAALEKHAIEFGDPEEQLRLAYHYEHDLGDPEALARAKALYKQVRDQRVGSVRLRIGNEYLTGANGFPRDAATAARWYGFAAKGGSSVACKLLAEMGAGGC
jgi:TPR repeat protein